MSNLGPYGTTEEFFKRREHLLKNKPKNVLRVERN